MTSPVPASGPRLPARALGGARLGILLMVATNLVFAIQDAFARKLGTTYSPFLVVMLRYWFVAGVLVAIAAALPGGLAQVLRPRRPLLQSLRGLLLVGDVAMTVFAFVAIGIVNAHAIFTVYPLLAMAISGPILGERIGWRRWTAVAVGLGGTLVILRPDRGALDPAAILALTAAVCFALYGVLTRLAQREDDAFTSFFWASLVGAVAITPFGLAHWQMLAPVDWWWMLALCVCSVTAHWMLTLAYAFAEASVLQPFGYTLLGWVAVVGFVAFGERLAPNVLLGLAIVVGAGLFSIARSRRAGT